MKRVTALDVVCPTCGASPGLRCSRLDGHGDTAPHPRRTDHAVKENRRLNPEHCDGQLPLWPGKVAS